LGRKHASLSFFLSRGGTSHERPCRHKQKRATAGKYSSQQGVIRQHAGSTRRFPSSCHAAAPATSGPAGTRNYAQLNVSTAISRVSYGSMQEARGTPSFSCHAAAPARSGCAAQARTCDGR
jgi:hypothetical protein